MQLTRLMSRNQFDEETAKSRILSQMPISEKVSYADEIVDKTGSNDALSSQVDALINKLHNQARWMWLLDWFAPPIGIASALFSITYRNLFRKKSKSSKRL